MRDYLIKLARISRADWGGYIVERNESLLKRLMLLEPYIGQPISDIPESVLEAALERTDAGCPHCLACTHIADCADCLWSAVGVRCTGAMFGEPPINLSRISDLDSVSVAYMRKNECLCICGHSHVAGILENPACLRTLLESSDFEACKRFLVAHIEWGKLDCWGCDLQPKP